MLPAKSVQIFNRHKRTLKRAQCTIVDLTTSFCIVYVQCAFTILTEKKRGNKMEIYAFSNYSCKSILQKENIYMNIVVDLVKSPVSF